MIESADNRIGRVFVFVMPTGITLAKLDIAIAANLRELGYGE